LIFNVTRNKRTCTVHSEDSACGTMIKTNVSAVLRYLLILLLYFT